MRAGSATSAWRRLLRALLCHVFLMQHMPCVPGADLTSKNEISKFMIRTSSPCHWEKDETSGKTMRQNQLAVDRVSEAELRGHVQEKTDLTVSCMHRFPAKPRCVAEPELGVFLRVSLLCPSGQGEPVAWLQPQLVSLQQVGAWSVVSDSRVELWVS